MSTVDTALSAVRDRLDEDGFFGDVTHGDLNDINDILRKLTPDERNQVISRLSESEINTWTDEIDNGGGLVWTGLTEGLSGDERKNLHQLLAQSLDAQQLKRVYNAYDDRDQKLELASAVAQNSTASTKANFVNELAADTTDKSGREIDGFIVYSSSSGDTEARAVAEVLGSLDGNNLALHNAYAALDDRQLNAVFEAAAQHQMHTSVFGGQPTYSYDVKPLTKLVDVAAAASDGVLKARVFEFAGRHLGTISGASSISHMILAPTPNARKEADALAASMSHLYRTDVNGITDALERDYQAGKGMAPFLEHLIESGDAGKAQIKGYIGQLACGYDGKGDAFARFTSPVSQDGDIYYPHAENLGYFAGSLHVAIEGITKNNKEQADLIKDIFGAVAGKIPTPGVNDAVGLLGKKSIDAVVDHLKKGDVELFEALVELTIPNDPRTGRVYDGPAENSYNEAWFSVTRQKVN